MIKLPHREHFIVPLILAVLLIMAHLAGLKDLGPEPMGIQPYSLSGLKGVILAPMLHADNGHLIGNLFPLMALVFLSFEFYGKITYWVLILGWLLVGAIVWAFPPFNPNYASSVHIGASGIVYVFGFFLFFGGIFNKKKVLTTLTLLIAIGFGSMFWGIFPEEFLGLQSSNISWQSHLSGAIVGTALSYFFKSNVKVEDKKFEWEGNYTLSEKDQALWDKYLEIEKDREEMEELMRQQEYINSFYNKERQDST